MRALGGEAILKAWEAGLARAESWRSLALLEMAMPQTGLPGADARDMARMPLGERNGQLLRLRVALFGRRMEVFAVCAECGAQLEFVVDAEELTRELLTPAAEEWVEGEGTMHMRPADTSDLAAVAQVADERAACRVLLARTMGLDESVEAMERKDWLERADLVERFERINAAAEIRCVLPCAECDATSVMDLDIAGFLWREVALAAKRLLSEIDRLARAYGWSETAILTLSGPRRAAYLEMLDA